MRRARSQCLFCGNMFGDSRPGKFCSKKCYDAFRREDGLSPFRNYVAQAKERGIGVFDLTPEYLKALWEDQKGACPHTGQRLELVSKYTKRKTQPYQASLDRIDSSKGYIKGNVQFVALTYNYAKNRFSHEDVLAFCEKVLSHRGIQSPLPS